MSGPISPCSNGLTKMPSGRRANNRDKWALRIDKGGGAGRRRLARECRRHRAAPRHCACPSSAVSLAQAKDKAHDMRHQIAAGVDPIMIKRIERSNAVTFGEACERGVGPYFERHPVRADPCERQRDRDIEIGRKADRRLARRSLKDAQRFKSAALTFCQPLPIFPHQRTLSVSVGMSEKCQCTKSLRSG